MEGWVDLEDTHTGELVESEEVEPMDRAASEAWSVVLQRQWYIMKKHEESVRES